MSAETRQPLQPLSLASLASSGPGPPPRSVFRGRVTSIRPYSPHTRLAQLTLASLDSTDPPQTTLEVELMGDVAFKASRRLHKGDTLILSTKGLVALPAKGKGKEGGKARPPRVRFERELLGWIRRAKNGDEEFLHYRDPKKRKTSPLLPSAPPPRGPRRASSPAHGAQTASDIAQPSSKRAQEPSPPASAAKKVSPPGEGKRSRKRRKVAMEVDEPELSWGFVALDGTRYTPLDEIGGLVDKTSRTNLQSTQINIVALVVDKGKMFEPRVQGRDWYRSFLIVDPSTTASTPIEVQWYAKAEAGLPEVQDGDVFVTRSLVLKSTSTALKPILLAKSFAVVPHAALHAAPLLASPPAQEPAPPPADAPLPVTSAERLVLRLAADELAYAARVAKGVRDASGGRAGASHELSTAEPQAILPPGLVAGLRHRTSGGGAPVGRPLLRVEEISEGHFCDIIGMVTKLHCSFPLDSVPSSCAASLYITDYTSHPLLFAYESSASVGLPGQLVLEVSVFGAQASPLSALLDRRTGEVRRGALVHLRNVRVKSGLGGALEGTMWEERDERFKGRRDVTVVDLRKREQEERWGDRAREVQRRHREYWAARSKA